jgi:DNA-binding CsgD family transcriptional regulator
MPKPDQRSVEALASLKLTPRESEVLLWISEGKSDRDIGIILGATTGTISKHVEHILSKLNVENRTTAAVIALEKCHSFARRSGREMESPRIAIVGFVVGQFCDLSFGYLRDL